MLNNSYCFVMSQTGHFARKPSYSMWGQQMRRLACASMLSDLCCQLEAFVDIRLFVRWTLVTLSILNRHTGWLWSFLVWKPQRQVFWQRVYCPCQWAHHGVHEINVKNNDLHSCTQKCLTLGVFISKKHISSICLQRLPEYGNFVKLSCVQ